MKQITQLIFPIQSYESHYSVLLLLLRLLFGGLLLVHGIDKWIHFDTLQFAYPDPLGVGSRFSLMLTIFVEVFCAGFVVLGLLMRPMTIPVMVTMAVAWLVVHHGQAFSYKELSFLFFVGFTLLFFAGPGRFSFDFAIGSLIRYHEMPKMEGSGLDAHSESLTNATPKAKSGSETSAAQAAPFGAASSKNLSSERVVSEKEPQSTTHSAPKSSDRPLRHKEGPLG